MVKNDQWESEHRRVLWKKRENARARARTVIARRYEKEWYEEYERQCAEEGIDPYPPSGRPPIGE